MLKALQISLFSVVLAVPAYLANRTAATDLHAASDAAQIPLGLISPTFPNGVPPSVDAVRLGRDLFEEGALSRDGTISCASCHSHEHGFADPSPVSSGVHARKGRRNSPTLLNVAYFEAFSWDGRHETLEQQALEAIASHDEMDLALERVAPRLSQKYGDRLRALYGEVSAESAAKALAAFQRSLVFGDAAFDRYMYANDSTSISESAKRGFKVFLRHGRCIQCHTIRCDECHPFGGSSAIFTNNRFHNLGIGMDRPNPDPGRAAVTGRMEDRGAFKTPSLRNVALTAPYMHDGSLTTLEEVVQHYNKGGIPNPQLDPEIRPLHLSLREERDLVEFLKTLTSTTLIDGSQTAKLSRPLN